MQDLISRQAAIDALKGLPTWWADAGGYYGGAQPPMEALLDPEDAVSAIENLPSAQPERKKGKWIWDRHNGEYYCSECKEVQEDIKTVIGFPDWNFCPNCGAEMENS